MAGNVTLTQVADACLACTKAWVGPPALHKPYMVAHTCRTRAVEAGGPEIQGYPWLHIKFEPSLARDPGKTDKQNHKNLKRKPNTI